MGGGGWKFKVEEFKLPRNIYPNISPKDFFQRIYFETYDRIHATLTGRFNQEDFKIHQDIQQECLNAVQGVPYETELVNVCRIYKDETISTQMSYA